MQETYQDLEPVYNQALDEWQREAISKGVIFNPFPDCAYGFEVFSIKGNVAFIGYKVPTKDGFDFRYEQVPFTQPNKPTELQPHYYRSIEDGEFLVPAEHIEAFDKCVKGIEETGQYSDVWYELTGEFSEKFEQYNQEGMMGSIILFVK